MKLGTACHESTRSSVCQERLLLHSELALMVIVVPTGEVAFRVCNTHANQKTMKGHQKRTSLLTAALLDSDDLIVTITF